jgi:ubiquinone/menaquinone biosynthesis C-methylase UbiE
MARVTPFEAHTGRYERWFTRHRAAYESELRALIEFRVRAGLGLEIGVGTARFAGPLGIRFGIDPSPGMLHYARQRGVKVTAAIAEALPFRADTFDRVLIVTTICFVDDARAMLLDTHRVLKPGGAVVIGFVDRTSRVGRHYETHRHENVFYREATFFSATEVEHLLFQTGFTRLAWQQTLTSGLGETTRVESPRPGVGAGAFIVVRGVKT